VVAATDLARIVKSVSFESGKIVKRDIAIIGGGIVGSAAAYFLARSGHAGDVVVLEPDSSYEFATTPQGAGGVRQQFSVSENVEMSRFSLGFFKEFVDHLSGIPNVPDIQFKEQGYLFLVRSDGDETLRRNHALQTSLGVYAELIDYPEIRSPLAATRRMTGGLTRMVRFGDSAAPRNTLGCSMFARASPMSLQIDRKSCLCRLMTGRRSTRTISSIPQALGHQRSRK